MNRKITIRHSTRGCAANKTALLVYTGLMADPVRIVVPRKRIRKAKRAEIEGCVGDIVSAFDSELCEIEFKYEVQEVLRRCRAAVKAAVTDLMTGWSVYRWTERIVTYRRWRNDGERLDEKVEYVARSARLKDDEVARYGILGACRRKTKGSQNG